MTRDVNGTRFSRVPKKFPVPGEKNPERENLGKLCTIHRYNSVATVRKPTDAAQWTPPGVPDAGRRPLCGIISFTIAAGVFLIGVTSR